jgi:eukaryotic-like serine/threonine-protein kinase
VENTKQWEKIKELFDAALEREPAQRDDFLRAACGSDESLRAEVQSLLSAHGDAAGMSQPPWPPEISTAPQIPESIGPYRLLKKLGEGGMGQVWLAEQSEPLHRQVALKLIRAGMFDDSTLRRFQAERQSLAIMDHPAIAKVFDAGVTPDGQPYFVMEYVPGEPITAYCDSKKLKIRERLELFAKACEGVQHAHQKAIIHRDLKPANILVVEIDGKPVPRIIDFGLAKAATPVEGASLLTQLGGFVGTPGYMSPEQAGSNVEVEDVDTRADVYSLGVVLYELLTGLLPFDAKDWKKQPLHEVMRQLREQEPPRPSTKVETEKDSSTAAAEMRGTQPKQLASLLHGDLDWITMKAIEKDRARRYGTPAELAADIERYLNNDPVLARPASPGYRLRKYIRRNRVAVGVSAGLVLLLAGFAGVEAMQLRRITVERDQATRERDRSSRITDFMTGMFKVSDPSEARGNSITAREILDNASKNIDSGLAKDPDLQSQMMTVMAKVYDNLGLYPLAESLLRRALAIREPLFGSENPETLNSTLALAWTLYHEGRYPEAEKLQRQTLASDRRVLGPEAPDTLVAMSNLAMVLSEEAHYSEAEALQRQVLDIRMRTAGPDSVDTALEINDLGLILTKEGRFAEAEKLQRQALDIRRRISGPNDPATLKSMNNLAIVLYREGQYPEAEALCRDTIAIERQVFGPEHPETLMAMHNLVAVLNDEGHYAEAAQLGQEIIDLRIKILGPEHPLTLDSMSNLAEIYTRMGRYADAEKLLKQANDGERKVLGPDNPQTAISTYNLAAVKAYEHKPSEALALLREAVDHGLPGWVVRGMAKDTDLNSLHGDPRFDVLVSYAKDHVAAAQKRN